MSKLCGCYCHDNGTYDTESCTVCYKHVPVMLWRAQADGHNEDQAVPDPEC